MSAGTQKSIRTLTQSFSVNDGDLIDDTISEIHERLRHIASEKLAFVDWSTLNIEGESLLREDAGFAHFGPTELVADRTIIHIALSGVPK